MGSTYLHLTALSEAKHFWFSNFSANPLQKEQVPLEQAHGRTLAEPAAAVVSSPAFHGAAMDGIAVNAKDTFGASEYSPKTLTIGENAYWINTGRPLPENTNAVIMVEHLVHYVEEDSGADGRETVLIEKAAFPWQHVRKLGEDMVATEILLPPGTIIGPYELGALAAAHVVRPVVFAQPKVAFIATGSELLPLDEITPEKLRNGDALPEFNSLMISAMVREAGGICRVLPLVPDDPEHIREALLEATRSDADLIVINAGSSAGSRDFTASAIKEAGELWVHGISIMPGKPAALGCVNDKPVIGLPGYPVSAVIAFEEFGQPLLACWQGREPIERPTALAEPFQPIPSRAGLQEYIRVKLGKVEDTLVAVPLQRGAGTVTTLSRADGILRVDAACEGIPAGRPVPVSLLRSPKHIAGAVLAIGSHDNTLDLIDSFLRKKHSRYSLTSAHVGSMGGLIALREGRCHIAGSHLLDPETGQYNRAAVAAQLADVPVHLVRLVDREQGLILPLGNPEKITGIADLAGKGVTFINRQRGSGTRVLLDWQMSRFGLAPADIAGYENEEYTHMNVAAAVLSGRAGAGLGVRAAANALGLEFVPVGVEEYDLVIPVKFWEDERIQALLQVIRSRSFQKAVFAMGGYGVEKTGRLIWTSAEDCLLPED